MRSSSIKISGRRNIARAVRQADERSPFSHEENRFSRKIASGASLPCRILVKAHPTE